MFSYRDSREGGVSRLRVDVAFTDSTVDLQGLRPGFGAALGRVEAACGVRFARVNQVHGADVLVVDEPGPPPADEIAEGDALVTTRRGVGLMIRVADCVPVLLADPTAGVIGAVHAGRPGMALDVTSRTVERMHDQGASSVVAWLGPHVCAACYEVPEAMRAAVASTVPASYATTALGTPALDIGAGVTAQLHAAGVEVVDVGGCTREEPALHSYRRDGSRSGRMAGLVWMS